MENHDRHAPRLQSRPRRRHRGLRARSAGLRALCLSRGEPGELADTTGPRDWQAEILGLVGDALREGHATQRAPIRVAVASGHGVGKSALVAWIVDWALATHEQARVIVTANTGGQLQTKTWPEIAKWFNLLICRHWFELAATSLRVPAHKETWRADQVTW